MYQVVSSYKIYLFHLPVCLYDPSGCVPPSSPDLLPEALNMATRVLRPRRNNRDDFVTVPQYQYTPLGDPTGMLRLLVIDPESGNSVNPATRTSANPERYPSHYVPYGAAPKPSPNSISKPTPSPPAPSRTRQGPIGVPRTPRAARPANIPGAASLPLMCWLVPYRIGGEIPPYDALSWSWGDPKAPKSKSVRIWSGEGKHKLAKEIKITKNLEEALLHLRDKTKPRFLWVDALCINQSDFDEKEDQMGQMDIFYENAAMTCVWLGKQADESQRMPAFIKRIVRFELEEMITDVDTIRLWSALSKLMTRDWFTRRWCVQEIALAKKAILQVGHKKIDWQDFADAVFLLEEKTEDIIRLLNRHELQRMNVNPYTQMEISAPGALNLVETLTHLFRKSEKGELERLASIETLVYTLSSYNVGVPRDAIYSLLKLGKDTFNMDPIADIEITYNTTTQQVYIDFIEKVFKKSKSLDIICLPWAPPRNEPHARSLPSWINPIENRAFDMSYGNSSNYYSRTNADALIGRLGVKTFSAAGRVLMNPMPEVLGKEKAHKQVLRLRVRGRVIGEVDQLGCAAIEGRIHHSWQEMAAKSSGKPNVGSGDDASPEPYISKAFWRTLVADRGPKGAGPPGWYQRTCQKCFNIVARDKKPDPVLDTDVEIHNAMFNSKGIKNRPLVEFLRRVQAATWNRRFMITVGGKFGLAPAEAQLKDKLCLLWGCTVPVILRPLQKKNCLHWEFIGACYIHGIMNGELLEKNPKYPLEVESEGTKIGNKTFEII
ncbi:Heterokaryon incompatibility protein 6 OR allele [Lachnellula suecica]|uniref:Heterokaryon incompatibility protein 6 OR allele n=1 Tax=Lachnellula suecica TaxID=602035 RepID=A0A8T9C187_9HELO|nr:Heterokaryon incompatibility protein 6 OR allele [Lachnellula suecica]